jgi:hypothetical protein
MPIASRVTLDRSDKFLQNWINESDVYPIHINTESYQVVLTNGVGVCPVLDRLAVGVHSTVGSGVVVASDLNFNSVPPFASLSRVINSYNQILNCVQIFDTNNEIILDGSNPVYGLLQCRRTVGDGAFGRFGLVKLSTVTFPSGIIPVLYNLSATVNFQVNRRYARDFLPYNVLQNTVGASIPTVSLPSGGGSTQADSRNARVVGITSFIPSGTIITVNTSGAGWTVERDSVNLGSNSTVFAEDTNIEVNVDGILQLKGVGLDVEWLSSSSLKFNYDLFSGQRIIIMSY